MAHALHTLTPRVGDGLIDVLIETPAGSRHKYEYLHDSGLFRYTLELPQGVRFPFGFGFVPNTLAEDGDALDVLLMVDGSVPQGTLVASRLIGVLQAEQDEGGEMVRNDRVIAVAEHSRTFSNIRSLEDSPEGLSWDLDEFFSTYNRMIEREFRVIGVKGKDAAEQALDDAIEKAR